MIHTEQDMKRWKSEQIDYFRKYLGSFEKESAEYRTIKRGIAELEKTMVNN